MRKPLIAANWKMNHTLADARHFIKVVKPLVPDGDRVETVICPPALFLHVLTEESRGSAVGIGAQNMHFEKNGAYTGEISPFALRDLGVRYSIVGHSERRLLFGESDELIQKKVKAAFQYDLVPIVCVGETEEEREAGKTEEVVTKQVREAFAKADGEALQRAVIAYEPVWAIGTGKTASAEDAEKGCSTIRHHLAEQFSEQVAQRVRILYGGSVKPDNIELLLQQENIDGALVGGASLEPESFLKLAEAANHV